MLPPQLVARQIPKSYSLLNYESKAEFNGERRYYTSNEQSEASPKVIDFDGCI